MEIEIQAASVSKLQDLMAHGEVTSSRLVEQYVGRIEERHTGHRMPALAFSAGLSQPPPPTPSWPAGP